jgi:hypothetical protein
MAAVTNISWFQFERLTIQSEENSFQVPRSFTMKEQSKMGSKTQEIALEGLPQAPTPCSPAPGTFFLAALGAISMCTCAWRRVKTQFCLFFKLDRRIKDQFSSLNP